MRGLHPATSKDDCKSAIEERLPTVILKTVFIHREPECETTHDTLTIQKQYLQESLLFKRGIFPEEGRFSICLRKPSLKDSQTIAYLTFQDSQVAQAAERVLN